MAPSRMGVLPSAPPAARGAPARTGDSQSVAARRLTANPVRTQVGQEAPRQTQTLVAEVDDD